jgi:hypothetical protein
MHLESLQHVRPVTRSLSDRRIFPVFFLCIAASEQVKGGIGEPILSPA